MKRSQVSAIVSASMSRGRVSPVLPNFSSSRWSAGPGGRPLKPPVSAIAASRGSWRRKARASAAVGLDPDPEKWEKFRALIAHYQDEANGFPARLRPQKLTWGSDYDHLSRKGEWADGDDPEDVW